MEKTRKQGQLQTEYQQEWLDATGGIPDVSGWLDETTAMPELSDWEEGFSETTTLPRLSEEEEAEEEADDIRDASAGVSECVSEEVCVSEDDYEGADWENKEYDYPRLHPSAWDDDLDEEPEDWYGQEREDAAAEFGDPDVQEEAEPEPEDLPGQQERVRDGNLLHVSILHGSFLQGSAQNRSSQSGDARYRDVWMWAAAAGLAAAIAAVLIGSGVSHAQNRKLQEQRVLLAQAGASYEASIPLQTDVMTEIASLRLQAEEEKAREEEAARKEAQEEEELLAEEGSVEVDFALSTIQSDLKIKIRRKKEKSLIGGVPFAVKVKGPDGKTSEQTDTDEDGIIYLTGLSNGKYEVSLCQLIDLQTLKSQEDYTEDPDYIAYSRYRISEEVQSADVTDHIAYEVVDVSDEVKSASEVNAAKEDTAHNDTPVESKIKDTVEWVESGKTEIEGESSGETYEEVKKDDVPDPYAEASLLTAGDFRMLAGVMLAEKEETAETGETQTEGASSGTSSEAAEGSSEATEDSSEAAEGSSEASSGSSETKDAQESSETSGQEPSESETPTLSVDPAEIHLAEGKTQSIKASASHAGDTTITFSSSDSEIATVSDGGTVQGVKAGSCTITVSLKDYTEVTRKVSVTVTEKTDDSSALKDSSGNPLYVRDGDSYRAATAGDYSRYDTFYRKKVAEKKYRYTGWQHINGLTYYYDKNGNYVTGSQIIQGVSYVFSSEGILDTGSTNTGIDVSMWNGSISWSEVASSGISFAIVRCGYRGSSTGTLVKDSMVGTNVTGARNAGLKVGMYFFSQAVNEAEAVEEASMAVQMAKSYGISMPIFLDVESSGGRGDAISVSQRTANIAAFCRTVQNAGFSVGVYANTNWFTEKINVSALTSYHIWLAQYAEAPTYSSSRYDIWQYSSTGRVNGISGDVDLDISYRSY